MHMTINAHMHMKPHMHTYIYMRIYSTHGHAQRTMHNAQRTTQRLARMRVLNAHMHINARICTSTCI